MGGLSQLPVGQIASDAAVALDYKAALGSQSKATLGLIPKYGLKKQSTGVRVRTSMKEFKCFINIIVLSHLLSMFFQSNLTL